MSEDVGEALEAAYVRALGDDPVALDAWRTLRALAGWECRPYRSGQTLTATIRPKDGWLAGAPAQFTPDTFVRFVREAQGQDTDLVTALTRRLERAYWA
jgi:hypothetical protein